MNVRLDHGKLRLYDNKKEILLIGCAPGIALSSLRVCPSDVPFFSIGRNSGVIYARACVSVWVGGGRTRAFNRILACVCLSVCVCVCVYVRV